MGRTTGRRWTAGTAVAALGTSLIGLPLGLPVGLPLAAAAPPGAAEYGASAEAAVLHLGALDLGAAELADVTVGHAAGRVGSTSAPAVDAEAANLEASLLGLPVDLLARSSRSAPPDDPTPAVNGDDGGTVPGLLSLGISDTSATARWAGADQCVAATTPVSASEVTTADVSLLPLDVAGTPVEVLRANGVISASQSTSLRPAEGPAGSRAVVATARGSVADLALLGGQVGIAVVDAPVLTATADGQRAAAVEWSAPVVTVEVAGSSRVLPADGSPLDVVLPDNPLLGLELRLGQLRDVVQAADGTTASASAAVLEVEVSLAGTVTVLDAELMPLSVRAQAPAGGLQCPEPGTPGEETPGAVPPGGGTDSDGDGVSDEDEAQHGTDPHSPDTDQDGFADGEELRAGTDPRDRLSIPRRPGPREAGAGQRRRRSPRRPRGDARDRPAEEGHRRRRAARRRGGERLRQHQVRPGAHRPDEG